MSIKKYTILKEYVYDVPGLDHPILARIEKCDASELPFRWAISHYYRPTEQAKLYHPSSCDFSTQKEAEEALGMYAKCFTDDIAPSGQYLLCICSVFDHDN